MHPEDRPALDEAEREARLVAELRGAPPPRTRRT